MQIEVKKLRESAQLPHRGSAFAAGYDLYAAPADGQPVEIAPHTTAMVGTGLAVAIPEGYFGGVFARSGLASKQGLRPANCVGVIDADYRDYRTDDYDVPAFEDTAWYDYEDTRYDSDDDDDDDYDWDDDDWDDWDTGDTDWDSDW